MQKVLGQFNDFIFFHIKGILVHDTNENDHLEHGKMTCLEIIEVGLKLGL